MNEVAPRPFIVVGVDGSELSEAALRWAVGQARLTGAEVHAVMAWNVPVSIYLSPVAGEERYEREAEEVMDTVLRAVAEEARNVPVTKRMVGKHPSQALVRAADGAELLVVGSHGHGGFPGMHLGSVATYCVHHAPCPVLVYRGEHTGR